MARTCAQSYKAHNWGVRNEFTMDLHGLMVDEALQVLGRQLDALQRLVVPEGVMLKVRTRWLGRRGEAKEQGSSSGCFGGTLGGDFPLTPLAQVITGRGNNSRGGVAAIKLAVLEALREQGLRHFVEPGNDGVVCVHVQCSAASLASSG